MSAKDESYKFDFGGTFSLVQKPNKISYILDDGRTVEISFSNSENSENTVKFSQTFEAESQNSLEIQKGGWLAIMENFKKYVEEN
jgi:hypothetical protein